MATPEVTDGRGVGIHRGHMEVSKETAGSGKALHQGLPGRRAEGTGLSKKSYKKERTQELDTEQNEKLGVAMSHSHVSIQVT